MAFPFNVSVLFLLGHRVTTEQGASFLDSGSIRVLAIFNHGENDFGLKKSSC